MIYDTVNHWTTYPFGDAWSRAFGFLLALSPDAPDGRIEIAGNDLYAVAMSYRTKGRDEGILETHRTYVDLQMVISGRELCEWHPADRLTVGTPYDESKDAQFYLHPEEAAARMTLVPGNFAVFFPNDAHMPSLTVDGRTDEARKVVVKIRRELLDR